MFQEKVLCSDKRLFAFAMCSYKLLRNGLIITNKQSAKNKKKCEVCQVSLPKLFKQINSFDW